VDLQQLLTRDDVEGQLHVSEKSIRSSDRAEEQRNTTLCKRMERENLPISWGCLMESESTFLNRKVMMAFKVVVNPNQIF
jgi:hypothetical protein